MFREVVLKFTRDLAAAVSAAPVVGDVICSASEIGKTIACRGLKTVSWTRKESNVQTEDNKGEISSGSSSGDTNAVFREEMMAGEVRKNEAVAADCRMYRLPALNCSPPHSDGMRCKSCAFPT